MGRPYGLDSERRRREFLRLLAAGEGFEGAAAAARIAPGRVLRMLDSNEFWTVARQLRDQATEAAA